MGTPFAPEEDRLILENYRSLGAMGTAHLLVGRSFGSVWKRAIALGFVPKVRRARWSNQDLVVLRQLYGHVSPQEIARGLGRSLTAIGHKAFRTQTWGNGAHVLSIVKRIHSVDKRFFDEPNELNSYWAGFIAADGCVEPTNRALVISLAECDRDHLRLFASAVKWDGPIRRMPPSGRGRQWITRLCIYGVPEWIRSLRRNFNITPRKSLTLKPPGLREGALAAAFIRGLIDGDGGIRRRPDRRGSLGIYVCATESVMVWVRSWFDNVAPTGRPGKGWKHGTPGISQYEISGRRAERILKWLAASEGPRLERKWNLVSDLILT